MKFTRVFAFMALAGLAGSAYATNGYFSHGYGMKAKGRAGAATATYDDAFGWRQQPCCRMAFAGDRIDLGLDWFSPIREMSRTGSTGNSSFGHLPWMGRPKANQIISLSLSLVTTRWSSPIWHWV